MKSRLAISDTELAKVIFQAMRNVNPGAVMWGDPESFAEIRASDVVIDGTFNFCELARAVRDSLESRDAQSRS
jgi:hypothetical protein